MKKLFSILCAAAVQTFAFHDFTMTPATANLGVDNVTFHGSYEHAGDTMMITALFLDANANGIFDRGDYSSIGNQSITVIDGGTPEGDGPSDTQKDGIFDLTVQTGSEGPFTTAGIYICIVESDEIADTAQITVVQTATNTYIKGSISDPDGNPLSGIAIRGYVYDESNNETAKLSSLTDSQGKFVVYLNDNYRNHKISLGLDINNSSSVVDPKWLMPSSLDTFIVDSLININVSFKTASHFVKGSVIDENGNSVKNGCFYLKKDNGEGEPIRFTTDNNGKFMVGVTTGGYFLNQDQEKNELKYFYEVKNFNVTDAADTVNIIYHCLTADTTISGTIHDDSSFLGNSMELLIDVYGSYHDTMYQGSLYTKTAGTYSIRVNSRINSYDVYFRALGFYDKWYICPTHYELIDAGTDTCGVWIKKADATISGHVTDSTSAKLFADLVFIDSTQGLNFPIKTNDQGDFSQPVPVGVYKIYYSGFSKSINKNVGGVFGPITITDKDTTVNLIATVSGYSVGISAPVKTKAPSFSFSAVNRRGVIIFNLNTPVKGLAKIQVFNLGGRLVKTIFEGKISTGAHEFSTIRDNSLRKENTLIAKVKLTGSREYIGAGIIRLH